MLGVQHTVHFRHNEHFRARFSGFEISIETRNISRFYQGITQFFHPFFQIAGGFPFIEPCLRMLPEYLFSFINNISALFYRRTKFLNFHLIHPDFFFLCHTFQREEIIIRRFLSLHGADHNALDKILLRKGIKQHDRCGGNYNQ